MAYSLDYTSSSGDTVLMYVLRVHSSKATYHDSAGIASHKPQRTGHNRSLSTERPTSCGHPCSREYSFPSATNSAAPFSVRWHPRRSFGDVDLPTSYDFRRVPLPRRLHCRFEPNVGGSGQALVCAYVRWSKLQLCWHRWSCAGHVEAAPSCV